MKYSNLSFKTINVGLVEIGPHFVGSLSNAHYYSFNGNIMTHNVRNSSMLFYVLSRSHISFITINSVVVNLQHKDNLDDMNLTLSSQTLLCGLTT